MPTIYVFIKFFLMKFSIFTAENSLCILHGQVFVMRIYVELYCPSSETKGVDYCPADLRLCFRLCVVLVFSSGGSLTFKIVLFD